MSSNISITSTPSQTRTSSILSSGLLSMDPSASALPPPVSSLLPFPGPPGPPSSTSSPPSSSPSPTGSSSFSPPISSESSSISSVISSKESSNVPSSTTLTSSSTLGTTLSASTSAAASNRGTMQVAAIVLGVVTAILGIAAVFLICCNRPKRHRHRSFHGFTFAKEKKSSPSDAEAQESPSGQLYFRSLYDQKGTITPLLQYSTPDTSDLSHAEPYEDTELSDHVLIPVPIHSPPPQTSSWHEIPAHPTIMQNTTSIRPPRSSPPPQLQENPRQFLSLTIPEFIAPRSSPQESDSAVSRAYADESRDVDGDSPSIYSQPSVHVLSRGPSVSSHISPPNHYDPDPDSQQSHLNTTSGLDRQNTTAIASLLKSRQRQSELMPIVPSGVSHIERAGSIKPALGADVVHEGVGVGREPYGRRFRRMKAEQWNSGMAT